jgi:alkylation response protein AidB-like acyl-CoA dehydrogenase
LYKLNQEQEILRETIRDFARNVITPLAPRIDSDGKIPEEIFSKLAGMGLFGITLPTNLGGAGADFISFLVAIEELSKASGSLGVILSVHNSVCEALMASKNSELKEKLLSKLVCGDVGAFCMSTEESNLECSFSGD